MDIEEDFNQRVYLVQGDITAIRCDVIFNVTDEALSVRSLPSQAIMARGGPKLRNAFKQLRLSTGESRMTKAYGLPAKAVIHIAAPTTEDPGLLKGAIETALTMAVEKGYRTIVSSSPIFLFIFFTTLLDSYLPFVFISLPSICVYYSASLHSHQRHILVPPQSPHTLSSLLRMSPCELFANGSPIQRTTCRFLFLLLSLSIGQSLSTLSIFRSPSTIPLHHLQIHSWID